MKTQPIDLYQPRPHLLAIHGLDVVVVMAESELSITSALRGRPSGKARGTTVQRTLTRRQARAYDTHLQLPQDAQRLRELATCH